MSPASATPAFAFSKMHGIGNDFVIIDMRTSSFEISEELCLQLSDRHIGVGCDQIITIHPAEDAKNCVAKYLIWNSDGSKAQQCGNGARCVAAWLVRDAESQGKPLANAFNLQSPTRVHHVQRHADGQYSIEMGKPDFDPAALPYLPEKASPTADALELNNEVYHYSVVSMGNPHAVVDTTDIVNVPVEVLATQLQTSAAFPDSVNVGFAELRSPQAIALRVYERGVGETLACGSGACAAAAVLMQKNMVDRTVNVHLPGGVLTISWPDQDQPMVMTGSATFVFEGRWLQ